MKNRLLILGFVSLSVTSCALMPVKKQEEPSRLTMGVPINKKSVSQIPPLAPIPTELQSTMSQTTPTQLKNERLKTEYDIVLLALLDSLKQKGDPDYLAKAHIFAQNIIVPSFKPSEQIIIKPHSIMRHNQAQINGFYKEDFIIQLRYEIAKAQRITSYQTLPQTVEKEHQR